ncbi:bifunctional glutamate N-acetyltransferase/amino-acid acetyltransferase ArgJ [Endothiovibrio diazotrophicus]
MAVGLQGLPVLHPVPGVRLGAAAAGIRYQGRDDLVVLELAEGGRGAAVFTRNAFCAAPVTLARRHLAAGAPRFLLVNSGNANAGTGAAGMVAAEASCAALAGLAGCAAQAVLPFSTGVIGEPLNVERLAAGLPAALADLSEAGWERAARAIMTTDTVAKGASRQVVIEGRTVTVTGIAKGSGMIRPDMATMLAYVATDAPVSAERLQECLEEAVNESFNRITVDGDTSTNDACVLVASGRAEIPEIQGYGPAFETLCEAVTAVCMELAQAIIRDGEGATKFITVEVLGGRDERECLDVAYTIAHSPLVKTAFHASDPNWGRILAAVGRAGVEEMDLDAVTIRLGEVCIVRDGGRDPAYTEAAGQAVMNEPEITVTVDLGRGDAKERVWTTDLSYEYVRINAEYRT